ncbi:MAG: hypothetical protein LBP67_00290 [Bacteroidales bacterium]|jgi:TM2 domain-containing membrane protein YozV|nr:hypothetical protein [Bacteroidales bacterium]
MKNLFLLLSLTVFVSTICFSQDIITKLNGEDIQAVILETSRAEVKYKKYGYMNGPIYTISTSDIIMIRYEDGEKQIFVQQAQTPYSYYDPFAASSHKAPEGINPNMLYNEYKGLYQPSLYVSHYSDPYNPAIAGVCSYFIPGLGQMLCGEVGRGFAYLGGTVGCFAVSVTGMAITAAFLNPAGLVIFTCGLIGCAAIDICSIIDAVKVAKIKNMYTRDIRNMTAINIELAPYIDYLTIGNNFVMPVGASLIVSF